MTNAEKIKLIEMILSMDEHKAPSDKVSHAPTLSTDVTEDKICRIMAKNPEHFKMLFSRGY